jgi:hypothetical protein
MQQQHPDQGDDTAALEGEAAHWVLTDCVLEGVIIEVGDEAPNGVRVTSEMITGADLMLRDIVATLGPEWRSLIRIEQRLPPVVTLHPENWGTPDVYAVVGNTIHVWDYKYGYGYVEVYENWQLINYFALIFLALGLHDCAVKFTIVQPRSYGPEGPVRRWATTAVALRAHVNVLRNSYGAALGPQPRLRVGPECDHCSARHACPELLRAGARAADYVRGPQPFDLSPAALGRELTLMRQTAELIKARQSGLEEQALRAIRAGAQVPGYAVGHGSGRQAWTKPAAAVINTGKMLGLDIAKPIEPLTPKQAIARGMPESLVESMSTTPVGEAKLIEEDRSLAARVFGKTN